MKLPTQSDVAHMAGVSRTTVSYVLNDRAGGPIQVTEETRRRILKAARDIGYEPNAAARSLRMSITRNIGITLPDLNNPHMQAILSGASHEAQSQGYNLLLVSTEMQPEYEKASIRELLRRRIDGLILLPTFVNILEEEFKLLASRNSPIVVAGNYYERYPNLDTIVPGHDEGAALMMDYLINLGHRRIGLIYGVSRKPLGTERLENYLDALQGAGVSPDPNLIVETGISYQDGYKAGLQLLSVKPRPSAILAINDLLAVGAMHAAYEYHLRIPEDISIAGFDDNDYSTYLNPPLTSINVDARKIGKECVRLVIKRIENPTRPHEQVRIPFQLMERASTARLM
jgi:DNA-binding LacI/PurR family transcriptional regulator